MEKKRKITVALEHIEEAFLGQKIVFKNNMDKEIQR